MDTYESVVSEIKMDVEKELETYIDKKDSDMEIDEESGNNHLLTFKTTIIIMEETLKTIGINTELLNSNNTQQNRNRTIIRNNQPNSKYFQKEGLVKKQVGSKKKLLHNRFNYRLYQISVKLQ